MGHNTDYRIENIVPCKRNTLITRGKNKLKNMELLLLALPTIIFIFVFSYIPLYGLVLPFKDYKVDLGFFKSPWVGFTNFKFLFNSNIALRATRNTVVLNLLFIFVGTIVSIIFALMIFEVSRRAVKFYQTVLFFPYFVSWVVASYILLGLLDMDYGLINGILKQFGLQPVLWYSTPKYWPFILLFAHLWKGVGYTSLIYFASLVAIDTEYFEAAKIDGATRVQQIFYISVPFLKPMVVIMTILSIGNIFHSDFGLFYMVTQNSSMLYPVTDVLDTYVYRALKDMGDVGMSSAAGMYQSVVGFILVLTTNYIVKKINPENSLF